MPIERSAGIILFRETSDGRRYLIIRSSRTDSEIAKKKTVKEFWDFPKGILEAGESGLDAAKREAKEEVGIEDFVLFPNFKKTVQYFTRRDGKPIPKFVAMFLAKTEIEEAKLSWEHDAYKWLPYDEAREHVTLPQMKDTIEAAEIFLNTK